MFPLHGWCHSCLPCYNELHNVYVCVCFVRTEYDSTVPLVVTSSLTILASGDPACQRQQLEHRMCWQAAAVLLCNSAAAKLPSVSFQFSLQVFGSLVCVPICETHSHYSVHVSKIHKTRDREVFSSMKSFLQKIRESNIFLALSLPNKT